MTSTKSASLEIFPRCATTGKKRYASEKIAKLAAKQLRKDKGPKTKPYFCVYCEHWHIGHSRQADYRRRKSKGEIDWGEW